MNLAGVLSVDDYDARVPAAWRSPSLLPGSRSAIVLATGGADFYRAFSRSPEARADRDPVDRFLERVVREAARDEGGAIPAFYFERRGGQFADFVALAEAAGLGAPSRLAILIHPVFGPWLAIRALLLSERLLEPTPRDPGFEPCSGCPAPCQEACPGSAVPAAGFDLARCLATTQHEPVCQVGCSARRACVVGPQHRYDPEAERHHRRSALGSLAV